MDTHGTTQTPQTIGANIRTARLAQGMTQKDVADLIGATNRDVSRWESDRVEPGPKYRHLLARVLFDGEVSAIYRNLKAAA